MVNSLYPLLLSAVALLIAIVGALALFVYAKRHSNNNEQMFKQNDALQLNIRKLQQNLKNYEDRIHEVQTGLYGTSDKLSKVEQSIEFSKQDLQNEIAALSAKIQEIETADPGSRLYSKGAKLVASGATIEEIMQECDLPRAEAELLLNLHKK